MIDSKMMNMNVMNKKDRGEDDTVYLMKRINSKVILQNERGSMNDITLEWRSNSVIFRLIEIQLSIDRKIGQCWTSG